MNKRVLDPEFTSKIAGELTITILEGKEIGNGPNISPYVNVRIINNKLKTQTEKKRTLVGKGIFKKEILKY